MISRQPETTRELFATTGEGGARWMFSLLPDGVWEITRDGCRVDAGPTDGRSLRIGLEKFMTLSRAGKAACAPVVLMQLDGIEGSIVRGGVEAINRMPAHDSPFHHRGDSPESHANVKLDQKTSAQMRNLT